MLLLKTFIGLAGTEYTYLILHHSANKEFPPGLLYLTWRPAGRGSPLPYDCPDVHLDTITETNRETAIGVPPVMARQTRSRLSITGIFIIPLFLVYLLFFLQVKECFLCIFPFLLAIQREETSFQILLREEYTVGAAVEEENNNPEWRPEPGVPSSRVVQSKPRSLLFLALSASQAKIGRIAIIAPANVPGKSKSHQRRSTARWRSSQRQRMPTITIVICVIGGGFYLHPNEIWNLGLSTVSLFQVGSLGIAQ